MRLYNAIIVLIDTGIRTGELYKLTPQDVTHKGDTAVIYLRDTKNGESRIVPLTHRAHNSLKELINTSYNKTRILGDEYPNWIDKNWQSMKKSTRVRKRHSICTTHLKTHLLLTLSTARSAN